MPLPQRNPAGLFFKHEGLTCLFDCGEGTQHRMHEFGVKIMRLKYIFISHLHGDHIFGLPGLLATLDMYGRAKPLKVFGPQGIKSYIEDSLKPGQVELRYPVIIEELPKIPYNFQLSENYTAESFPLDHSIPTLGYALSMKSSTNEKDGQGRTQYESKRKFGYVTDTLASKDYMGFISKSEVLYHEATFLNAESENALKTKHSTAEQAATIARDCEVKNLIIGHYSARYRDLEAHLREAKAVFPATLPAIEGNKHSF